MEIRLRVWKGDYSIHWVGGGGREMMPLQMQNVEN